MQELGSPEAEQFIGLKHKILLGAGPEAPLVLLVHGRAGSCEVMWTFRRCIPEGAHILAPQARIPDSVGGFSWWEVPGSSTEEGARQEFVRGAMRAGIPQAREVLVKSLAAALSWYHLRPRFMVAYGFSQGGGLLSSIIQINPSLFKGVGILAGFVVPEQESPPSPRPEVFMAHGTNDLVVPLEHSMKGKELLESKGFQVEYVTDPVGHKVGSSNLKALRQWTERIFEAH